MTVTPSAFEDMVNHARAELPNECCGLLGGTGDAIRVAIPVVNERASPVAYLTEPQSMFDAVKVVRAAGLAELGVYHSHPTGRAVPSATDVAEWTYGNGACVIIGLGTDEPSIRAWQIHEGTYDEIPLAIPLDDGADDSLR